jgi:hypothetical protein
VGDDPLAEMDVEQRRGCFGTWSAEAWDRKSKVKGKPRRPTTKVGQVGVDELLEVLYTKQGRDIPHIPLMKIDAEGKEEK